jgi:dTDP-glucose 4,6-dehydratase
MICATLERLSPAGYNSELRGRGLTSYNSLKTFAPDRPGHDRRYAIDASKARSELGGSPTSSPDSGLERTVAWYIAHRAWCATVQGTRYTRERLGLAGAGDVR